jgi:hypothetical protein
MENQFHNLPLNVSQEMDLSMSMESTSDSPYFYSNSYSSDGSSRESPYEDSRRKPRKKPLDEDEKLLYVIRINRVLRDED